MRSPFDSDQIDLEQAIQWIAETVYPDDRLNDAKKRVRRRVNYAADTGKISIKQKGNTKLLETQPFFSWAVTRWPDLRAIVPVPYEISPPAGKIHLTSQKPDVFEVNVPNDYEGLKKAYIEAETECHRLTLENTQLRSIIADLETEVMTLQKKDAETRRKKSEAGQRGKGVSRRR